ncbi:acyltransferase [Bradyrhizobium diazoefficiens]|nr:acyltransferase [Bradyrhizobium diazoefficiens]
MLRSPISLSQSPDSAEGSAQKIGAVNGFRGLAIMMVVVFHLFVPFTSSTPSFPGELDPNGLLALIAKHGFLGVNIFFVLSGFVLYLPYRTKKRAINRLADFPEFYWHRGRAVASAVLHRRPRDGCSPCEVTRWIACLVSGAWRTSIGTFHFCAAWVYAPLQPGIVVRRC